MTIEKKGYFVYPTQFTSKKDNKTWYKIVLATIDGFSEFLLAEPIPTDALSTIGGHLVLVDVVLTLRENKDGTAKLSIKDWEYAEEN